MIPSQICQDLRVFSIVWQQLARVGDEQYLAVCHLTSVGKARQPLNKFLSVHFLKRIITRHILNVSLFPVYEVSFTNMCCCCRFLSIFPSSCLFCFPFAVGCRGRSSQWITKFQTKNFRQSDFAWPRISHVFLERWSSHHGNETR